MLVDDKLASPVFVDFRCSFFRMVGTLYLNFCKLLLVIDVLIAYCMCMSFCVYCVMNSSVGTVGWIVLVLLVVCMRG